MLLQLKSPRGYVVGARQTAFYHALLHGPTSIAGVLLHNDAVFSVCLSVRHVRARTSRRKGRKKPRTIQIEQHFDNGIIMT